MPGTLTSAFVAPWARGHGLGRGIVLEIERLARARLGLVVLNLDLRDTQKAAIRLYESLGYRRWGTHPDLRPGRRPDRAGALLLQAARRRHRHRRDPLSGDRPQGRPLRAAGARRDGERDRVQRRSGGAGARLCRGRVRHGCTSSISNGAVRRRLGQRRGGAAIRQRVDLRIQLGGGIRDRAAIEAWLELGIDRVVLGTAALRDPDLVQGGCGRSSGPHRRRHRCARRPGRGRGLGRDRRYRRRSISRAASRIAGVAAIVYTDIERDGALGGRRRRGDRGAGASGRYPGDRLGRRRLARRHRRAEGA